MPRSDITVRPWCPFCGQVVGKPRYPENRQVGEFLLGKCECGAVYVSDPTGFSLGAAMVECLVYACNDDWDLTWELIPETDYLTGQVDNYDEITHQVVDKGNLDGRKVKGVLFFVRLHKDIKEIAQRLTAKNSTGEAGHQKGFHPPEIEPERDPKRTKKRADKKTVKKMVEESDIDALVDLLFDDIKTLRFIQRLLYTPDDNLRWQTAHVLGKVCARFATRRPGAVSDLLHRLFVSCSDSASSSWGLLEAIGSILGERPDIFGAFSRHLLKYLEDEANYVQVLWALGTISKNDPALIRSTPFFGLGQFLNHQNAVIRALTVRLFGRIRAGEFQKGMEQLVDDQAEATIYEDGKSIKTTVAAQAEEALRLIKEEGDLQK